MFELCGCGALGVSIKNGAFAAHLPRAERTLTPPARAVLNTANGWGLFQRHIDDTQYFSNFIQEKKSPN